jgi:hypothetical protein
MAPAAHSTYEPPDETEEQESDRKWHGEYLLAKWAAEHASEAMHRRYYAYLKKLNGREYLPVDERKKKPPKSERQLELTVAQREASSLDIATRIERWGCGLTVEVLGMLIPISEPQIYAMISSGEITSAYRVRGTIWLDPVLTAQWLRTQAA